MGNRHPTEGVERRDGIPLDESASRESPRDDSADLIVLMGRYAEGDSSAFKRVFALLSPRVFGFHLRTIGNTSLAEDLTQQTFLKLHVARRRYRTGAAVEPWVFAIAKNVQRDALRRRQRSREQLTDEGELPAVAEHANVPKVDDVFRRERIDRAIARLPEGQRDVLVLHKFHGLSMQEVADALGIGVSAAKVRAFRAYGALRKVLVRDIE